MKSFVRPYGFVERSGAPSSTMGSVSGSPYTVAELENARSKHACAASSSSRLSVPTMLFS